jgi:hypothetical protein
MAQVDGEFIRVIPLLCHAIPQALERNGSTSRRATSWTRTSIAEVDCVWGTSCAAVGTVSDDIARGTERHQRSESGLPPDLRRERFLLGA